MYPLILTLVILTVMLYDFIQENHFWIFKLFFFTHGITHDTKYLYYKLKSLHSWIQDSNAGNTSTSLGDSFHWAEHKAKKELFAYITFLSLN